MSLSASLTRTTVAANAQSHGSHPMDTQSSCLDRHMTRCCHGPIVCVRIPSAMWFFSCMKRLKSCVTSGSPNAGALVKSLFISLKAFSCSGPHSRGSLPDPTVAHTMVKQLQESLVSDLAESSSPEEFTDFFLGTWPRVLNRWFVSSHVPAPDALSQRQIQGTWPPVCRSEPFSMTPCTPWWRGEPVEHTILNHWLRGKRPPPPSCWQI